MKPSCKTMIVTLSCVAAASAIPAAHALTPTQAAAATTADPQPEAAPQEKAFYVNGAVSRISDEPFELDAFTARIGWHMSKHFGMEGEVSLPTGTDQQGLVGFELDETYAIFGTARTDLSNTLAVFARVGLVDTGVDVTTPFGTETEKRRSAAAGIGATVSFNGKLGLRVGYTYSKSDAFDAGIVWRF